MFNASNLSMGDTTHQGVMQKNLQTFKLQAFVFYNKVKDTPVV